MEHIIDGRVVGIDLANNGLRGELPASIGMLQQLKRLVLGGNLLRGPLPPSLVNCNQLVHLHVAQQHDRPHPAVQVSCASQLHMDNNMFESNLPSSIGKLQHLVVLQLKHNRIHGPIPDTIAGCTSLKVLSLSSNKLSGELPRDAMAQLTKLEKLAVGDNRLTGTIPDELRQLVALRTLQLRLNQFEGGIPDGLRLCTALTNLHLDSNCLSGPRSPCLADLLRLKELHLQQNTALQGSIPTSIGHWDALQLEGLFHGISAPFPASRAAAPRLLSLPRDNRLSGRIPENIGALRELQVLFGQSLGWTHSTFNYAANCPAGPLAGAQHAHGDIR